MQVTSDYKCTVCEHVFEDDLETEAYPPCPECGGDTRRVYSLGGITFKGPGFYKTDKT
jgi:putative FmdB family regulatory protein